MAPKPKTKTPKGTKGTQRGSKSAGGLPKSAKKVVNKRCNKCKGSHPPPTGANCTKSPIQPVNLSSTLLDGNQEGASTSQISQTVSPVRSQHPNEASNPGGQSHSDPTSQNGQNSLETTQNQLKNHIQTPHEKAVTDAIRTMQNSLANIQANQNIFDNRQLKYEERLK